MVAMSLRASSYSIKHECLARGFVDLSLMVEWAKLNGPLVWHIPFLPSVFPCILLVSINSSWSGSLLGRRWLRLSSDGVLVSNRGAVLVLAATVLPWEIVYVAFASSRMLSSFSGYP